jgi:hypothetical protein
MSAVAASAISGAHVVGIPDFNLFGGRHCETSAVQKVLSYAGVEYTEEFLFGMAGGIGFVFWNQAGMSTPFVGGRNGKFPDYVQSLGAALGHRITVAQTGSERRAYDALRAELEQGRPVVCYGDIHYLPYFHTQRHFGGHAFVVYAIDEPQGTAWISDRGAHPRRVTLQELAQARASKTKVFNPKNALLRIEMNSAPSFSAAQIWQAIQQSYKAMCEPPISNFGVAGLARFGKWLEQSIANLPALDLCGLLVSLYVNLELAGTGGCAFRRMYRQFLAESRQWLDPAALDEAISYLDRSIDSWKLFINNLLPPAGPATIQLVQALQNKEHAFEWATTEAVHLAAQDARRIGDLIQPAGAELATLRGDLRLNLSNLKKIAHWESTAFEILEQRRREQI